MINKYLLLSRKKAISINTVDDKEVVSFSIQSITLFQNPSTQVYYRNVGIIQCISHLELNKMCCISREYLYI